jgi:hypothetical protein
MDQFGNRFETELHHGEWKRAANYALRADGSRLDFAPWEQVEHQMQILIGHLGAMKAEHPMVRAAWLHHRFICIHPFEDGNGRVARALVLLVLLSVNYAPLVVEGKRRPHYIGALDRANEGDLAPLVRLFCELEIVALRSEFSQPLSEPVRGSAGQVAKSSAGRILELRRASERERQATADALVAEVHGRVAELLRGLAEDVAEPFREVDPSTSRFTLTSVPGEPRASWWKIQLIRAAKEANFWSNLTGGTWWVQLSLTVMDRELRYVAAIQRVGVGVDVGVRALTVFAEMPSRSEPDEDREFAAPVPLLHLSSADSVTMIAGQPADQVWPEVEALIDRTLAVAVEKFSRQLS